MWLMAIVLDSDKGNFSHHRKFCWTARSRIIVFVNVSNIGMIILKYLLISIIRITHSLCSS